MLTVALVALVTAVAGEVGAQGPAPTRTPRVLGNRARSPAPTPTAIAERPPAFGRVIYRAVKAAAFESLGVSMIACRHKDPAPRTFAVEFFERLGKKVPTFGPSVAPNVPPGKKIVFVTDASHFANRGSTLVANRGSMLVDVRLGHLDDGTARVISDAETVRCLARIRFDPGARAKSYWRSMGFYRAGASAPPSPVW